MAPPRPILSVDAPTPCPATDPDLSLAVWRRFLTERLVALTGEPRREETAPVVLSAVLPAVNEPGAPRHWLGLPSPLLRVKRRDVILFRVVVVVVRDRLGRLVVGLVWVFREWLVRRAGVAGSPPAVGGLAFGTMQCDAPGSPDDASNVNDEWVELVNTGGAAATLTGWKIHDEGPNFTYTFRASASAPARG
jgi:hypothetical protein